MSKEIARNYCTRCQEDYHTRNFYKSFNFDIHPNGYINLCKKCVKDLVSDFDNIEELKSFLRMVNKPFIHHLYLSAKTSGSQIGEYFKLINAKDFRMFTWQDSDFNENGESVEEGEEEVASVNVEVTDDIEEDINERDVKRLLGYDPFESENPSDKRYLYSRLIDFLDESTLEDSFKIPAVIEIVKAFNQLDKLNSALALIISDVKTVSENIGGVKHLIDAKEKMLKSVLALAKDNGISVNHNNNKSKGAGTLSGIIKQLHEKGIESAEINLYDIETSKGMKQVADISNKSILEQLMLNENDYTEMIREQREMILNYKEQTSKLEEENRLLKMEIKNLTSSDRSLPSSRNVKGDNPMSRWEMNVGWR